jgi:OOP family OmpA-OmpF porin
MRIEGHTDSSGPEAYNLQLSQRRAQAVADYILSQSYNVRSADIEVLGKGESDPIASNATAAGRAENRRVLVIAEGVIEE